MAVIDCRKSSWLGFGLIIASAACGGGDDGGGSGPPPGSVPVATLSVAPSTDTILIRDHAGFAVVAKDSLGRILTGRTVVWSLSDSSLATHSGGGTFFADQVGTVRLIATVGGVSDTATAVLAPVITVGRPYPSLFAGDTTQLTASTTDIFGAPVVAPAVTWTSGTPGIATVSGTGLVTAQTAGSAVVRATLSGSQDSQAVVVLVPRVGGNRELMFSTDTASPTAFGFAALWISNADGSGAHRISPQDFDVQSARWSADGSRIAFHGGLITGAGGSYFTNVMNFDGSGLNTMQVSGLIPAWSPDGTRLAVYLGDGSADVGVVQAGNGSWNSLQTGNGTDTRPQWSPDGRQILWIKEIGGNTCTELWVMADDGSNKRKVVLPTGMRPCAVSWSPDGKEVAIESVDGGIWLARIDGGGFRALSPNCTLATGCTAPAYAGAAWNPDGTKLAFHGAEAGSQSSVNVIGRSGTGFVTASLPTGNNPTYPQWSPDGQRLAFQAIDPADTTGVGLPLIIFTTDPDLQNPLYGRPGVRASAPRWRP